MATSTGVTTRSQAKALVTTITPVISDDEESDKDGVRNPSAEEMSKTNEIISNEVAEEVTVPLATNLPTVSNLIENFTCEVTPADRSLVSSNGSCGNHKVANDGDGNQKNPSNNIESVAQVACASQLPEENENSEVEEKNGSKCSPEELRRSLDELISSARKQGERE